MRVFVTGPVAYEQPRKPRLSAPAKIDFLSVFDQRAPEWAFFGAGKFI